MDESHFTTLPPELAGVAYQFNQIGDPAIRSALAASFGATIAAVQVCRPESSDPNQAAPPLGDTDQAIADCIDEHGPITAKRIAHLCTEQGSAFNTDQSVRDRMRKKLPLRRMGYRHDAGAGGYVSFDAGHRLI